MQSKYIRPKYSKQHSRKNHMKYPKKNLGQNFLTSEGAIYRAIEASSLKQGVRVLEIGPGHGALTRALLEKGAQVVAIEKDSCLVEELSHSFASYIEQKALTLINADATTISYTEVCPFPYIIVANIPYNITGTILRHIFSQSTLPERVVLIVQKEVGERIAREKKESVLSLSIKAYGTPRYLTTIKAGSFYPKPRVDSALITITNISKTHFASPNEERLFFSLIKNGFAQKRKILKRRLVETGMVEKDLLDHAYLTCTINEKARAEDLSLTHWLCLLKQIS